MTFIPQVPDHVNSLLAFLQVAWHLQHATFHLPPVCFTHNIFLQVASTFKDDNYLVVHCSAGVGRTGGSPVTCHLLT